MTFCPPLRSGGQKKQDFCKNAQWRAKKLRERGSSTARPTEKGGGGLPIGARPVDFVAISSRFRRDLRTSSCRFVPTPKPTPKPIPRRHPSRHPGDTQADKAQTQKKPDSSIGESGLGCRKASRALNLLLVPLSNNRASARSVRLGLARRSCIVMLTSDHRRIGRYI